MDSNIPDTTYTGWLGRWRKWKYMWTESTEVVIQFDIKFICRQKRVPDDFYGDLSSHITDRIGNNRIHKNGIIRIHTPYMNPSFSDLEIVKTPNGKQNDEFGIVTIRLDMIARKDILKIVRILEDMGHGVIHNGGIIVSSTVKDYNTTSIKNKLPHRDDDPVWDYV